MRPNIFRLTNEIAKLGEYNHRLAFVEKPTERKKIRVLKHKSAVRAQYVASQLHLTAGISKYQLRALESRISQLEGANPTPVKVRGRGEMMDNWSRMIKRRKS